MKTVLEQTSEQRLVLRQRDHAIANVAGWKNTVFAPQTPRASAVIRNCDDCCQVTDRMAVRFLTPSRDKVLQAAQQHRKPRAAADSDHTRARSALLRAVLHRARIGVLRNQQARAGLTA